MQNTSHKETLENLMERLNGKYFLIHNLQYTYNGYRGEVDLIALNKNLLLQFEVKGNHCETNRAKAMNQLWKAVPFLSNHFSYKKLGQFYVTHDSIEWIINER